MLTFEQQKRLVEKGLATEKVNNKLSTFKYARKVHFNNMWDSVDGIDIRDCRGHTYDNTNGNLIIASPRKSFNYLENNHWGNTNGEEEVFVFKKFNGFLGCASNYHGSMVVSTTGTTTSDYAMLAKQRILESNLHPEDGYTYWYEIIDESDPHIVDEGFNRAELIGRRNNITGEQDPYGEVHSTMKFKHAFEMAQEDKGEGFMVYLADDKSNTNVCKLKTPYYKFKKMMMRLNASRVNHVWKNSSKDIPYRYMDCFKKIRNEFTAEQWSMTNEMNRRKVIEEIIG